MLTCFFRERRVVEGLVLAVLLLVVSCSPALARHDDDDFIDLCGKGTPEAVRAAIRAGANVNAQDDDETALMEAAEKNPNSEVVAILLRAGANVNARDDDDETALMKAAEKSSNPEVVAILLRAGAKVNARDDDGETALRKARERGSSGAAIVKLLLEAGAKE